MNPVLFYMTCGQVSLYNSALTMLHTSELLSLPHSTESAYAQPVADVDFQVVSEASNTHTCLAMYTCLHIASWLMVLYNGPCEPFVIGSFAFAACLPFSMLCCACSR